MGRIKHKILVLSGKGGVGKSTTAEDALIQIKRMEVFWLCRVLGATLPWWRRPWKQRISYRDAIAKQDVAAEIGVTPEALSRLIRRLTEDKILGWKDDTVRVTPSWPMEKSD